MRVRFAAQMGHAALCVAIASMALSRQRIEYGLTSGRSMAAAEVAMSRGALSGRLVTNNKQ